MRPMLASPGSTIPSGPRWTHEIKWDGMRVLADVHDGGMRLTARSENEVTASFPELAVLAGLADDMLLDGEVVAFRDGIPSFAALADRMHVRDARRAARLATTTPVTYLAFDLLRLYGEDLTSQPLSARRSLLERLELDGRSVQVPPTYDDGRTLGDPSAPDQHTAAVVGERPVPPRPLPDVVARVAVGRDPVDGLPDALARVPDGALPVVTTTWALSRLRPERRLRFVDRLEQAGSARPVAWVSVEGVGVAPGIPPLGDRPASGHSIVGLALFGGPAPCCEAIGRCWARGRWLSWLPES